MTNEKTIVMKDGYLLGFSVEELSLLVAERVAEILAEPSSKSECNNYEYLTREDVAKLCKVKSLSTLWYWKNEGLLVPTSRAGRKPLYLKKDVIQFLEGKKGGNSND